MLKNLIVYEAPELRPNEVGFSLAFLCGKIATMERIKATLPITIAPIARFVVVAILLQEEKKNDLVCLSDSFFLPNSRYSIENLLGYSIIHVPFNSRHCYNSSSASIRSIPKNNFEITFLLIKN